MYFCNVGFCPTTIDNNTACQPGAPIPFSNIFALVSLSKSIRLLGRFGHYSIGSPKTISFFLGIRDASEINGTGAQCLTYYYYLPNTRGIQQNIRVKTQEMNNSETIIDTVTNSSFNGWIKRQVDYHTSQRGYEVISVF